MELIFRNGIPSDIPSFAIATPVLMQDKDSPKSKPDEKGKPKVKPSTDRELSDFEKEAIKRIAKLDPALAKKLTGKLPKKKTRKDQFNYISHRVKKLKDARTRLKKAKEQGFVNEKGLKRGLKRLDEIKDELVDIATFYNFGALPKWYLKLLKERKKKKEKKSPTTQGSPLPSQINPAEHSTVYCSALFPPSTATE